MGDFAPTPQSFLPQSYGGLCPHPPELCPQSYGGLCPNPQSYALRAMGDYAPTRQAPGSTDSPQASRHIDLSCIFVNPQSKLYIKNCKCKSGHYIKRRLCAPYIMDLSMFLTQQPAFVQQPQSVQLPVLPQLPADHCLVQPSQLPVQRLPLLPLLE